MANWTQAVMTMAELDDVRRQDRARWRPVDKGVPIVVEEDSDKSDAEWLRGDVVASQNAQWQIGEFITFQRKDVVEA